MTVGAPIDGRKLALARRFRRAPTDAEALAWSLLRDRQMLGLKFRRQQIIAGYVVDFYCARHRLVIEIDGGVHEARPARDAQRTAVFQRMGIHTRRIQNEDLSPRRLLALLSAALDVLPPLLANDASEREGGGARRGGPGG